MEAPFARFMVRALEEAKHSLKEGDCGFGAVVVRNGEVVASARDTENTGRDPTAHAEMAAVHAMILMLGGHYSYAKVPIGFWMEDWFGWTRNNYDKIGHLMQGFAPAIYVREIVARTSPLRRGKWLGFMSIAVPLAFSALYEIIEWLASLSNPTDTEAFLGTHGYIWDTQTDMFLCLVGSVLALIF